MLNAMSEKKRKKLIEFKIVKSRENESPRDSKSASPNIKIQKSSDSGKKIKSSEGTNVRREKIQIFKLGIFSASSALSKDTTKEEVNLKI